MAAGDAAHIGDVHERAAVGRPGRGGLVVLFGAREPLQNAPVPRINEVEVDGAGIREDDGGAVAVRRNHGALVHARFRGEERTAVVLEVDHVGGRHTGKPRSVGERVFARNPVRGKAQLAVGRELAEARAIGVAGVNLGGRAAAPDKENLRGGHRLLPRNFADERIGERMRRITDGRGLRRLRPGAGARIGQPGSADLRADAEISPANRA